MCLYIVNLILGDFYVLNVECYTEIYKFDPCRKEALKYVLVKI